MANIVKSMLVSMLVSIGTVSIIHIIPLYANLNALLIRQSIPVL